MAFTKLKLDSNILQAVTAAGYQIPTPIQVEAIPLILAGKDIVASAQTGTGKTAAYVIPILQFLSTKEKTKKPRVLILAPTRELANQITKVIDQYKKFIKVNIASFIGGMPYHKQLRELSRPIDIIIATPGRLMDHMENKRLDLSKIEVLVIDEADRMLDMGFIDDIKTIVKSVPNERQTLLFSATADSRLLTVMNNLLKNPVKINISLEKVDTNLIKQKFYLAKDQNYKNSILGELLNRESIFKSIIFSSTKVQASKLAEQLNEYGHGAEAMHGDMKQSARNRVLAKFRQGEVQFLVATDVASRGIDVADITHVINYDLPKFSEDYVHRIGRTGRAGKTGMAISIVLPSEILKLKKIERYLDNKITLLNMTHDSEHEIDHPQGVANRKTRQSKRKKPLASNKKSSDRKTMASNKKSSDRKPARGQHSNQGKKSHYTSKHSQPKKHKNASRDHR